MSTRHENIMVQCISDRLDFLAALLYTYIELLIGGRGRRMHLLQMVGSELEQLWQDSLTHPTCRSCLINMITMMELLLKAYMLPLQRLKSSIFAAVVVPYIYPFIVITMKLNDTIASTNFLFQIIMLINVQPFTAPPNDTTT